MEDFILLGIAILISALIITFSYVEFGKDIEKERKIKETILIEDTLFKEVNNLYFLKLPIFSKYYLQTLIDACLSGFDNRTVYYGYELGAIDALNLINQTIKANKWYLKLSFDNNFCEYGEKPLEQTQKFVIVTRIPLPNLNIGNLTFIVFG